MADALCGPSSSLDAFKKHTSVDRTLQQDRFSASQASAEVRLLPFVHWLNLFNAPSQGFRSSRAIVGALDAEFEAFQSDQPLQLKETGYGIPYPYKPANSVELKHLETEIPPWVAEFQSLQIANARAGFESQPQSQELVSLQPDFQDLKGQHAQFSHFLYDKQQIPSDSLHNSNHIQSRYHPQSSLSTNIEKSYDPRIDEAVENEAFERAFDAAAAAAAAAANQESFDKEGNAQREITGYEQNNLTNDNADALFEEKKDLPLYHPIGSDRIIDEVRKKKQQQVEENNEDELARTAGELLDNIKHEHSQKFKDSNFLSLMRQIRDREVRIEGDQVVEVSIP